MATKFEFYTTEGAENWYGVGTGSWVSQTFTPQIAHSLSSLVFKGQRLGIVPTITFTIKAVDGSSKPTGSDLSTGTYDGSLLPLAPDPPVWFTVTMPSTNFTVDTEYALIISAVVDPNYLVIKYNSDAGYLRGVTWYSDDNGATWGANPQDMLFEEWGISAFVPRVYIL